MQGRILLVEDDPGLLRALTEALMMDGHIVNALEDPATVPDVIESTPLDVIVSDVNLPGLSGYDIAEIGNRQDIPVVLMTAVNPTRIAPAAAFFRKPFDLDLFLDCIASLLEAAPSSGRAPRENLCESRPPRMLNFTVRHADRRHPRLRRGFVTVGRGSARFGR